MRCILPALVIAAALTAIAAPARAQNDRDWDRDYDGPYHYDSSFKNTSTIASGGTLRVEDLNGGIEVEASDNNSTTVTAVKKWRRGDPAMVHIVVEPSGNGLTVCALWDEDETHCGDHNVHSHHRDNDGHNDVSVHFTVRLAKGVKVDLNTVNGSVDVSGATAAINAETVNGRVEVATLSGAVTARSVNGSVRATIEHLVSSDEPLEFETVNGSVELQAPADLNADVDAETTNGGIETDFPLTISKGLVGKHVHGTIGTGGRRLELHTTNGSVKLRKLS